MISLSAAIIRAAIRCYTYPYRKRFASLSRSVALKNSPYKPPKGYVFTKETYCGGMSANRNGTRYEHFSVSVSVDLSTVRRILAAGAPRPKSAAT